MLALFLHHPPPLRDGHVVVVHDGGGENDLQQQGDAIQVRYLFVISEMQF